MWRWRKRQDNMEDINSKPFNLKIYRFTRVIFGVSAQPISSKCHHTVPSRETYRYQQNHNTYSTPSMLSLVRLGFQPLCWSKGNPPKRGFNLQKFLTNSKHLQERINHRENVKNDDVLPGEPTHSRVTLCISQMP